MATLHMEPDACRQVKSTMLSVKEEVNSQVSNLSGQVSGMIGSTWIAPGTAGFQDQFDTIKQNILTTLEQLQTLADQLEREIVDWETNAQTF